MKPNISALARLHGISRQTLATWKREGIDIADAQAIAERKLTMRGKPSATLEPPTAPGAETIAEARRRRAVADANFAELRAQREAGAVVDLATVEASFAALGHQLRAHLLALPIAAASELEGLTAAGIAAALRKHVVEILTLLYEQSHEATRPPEATD
jgi:transposase-like protein